VTSRSISAWPWVTPMLMRVCLFALAIPGASSAHSPAELRSLAHSYYEWRDSSYPVTASDRGKHLWDDRLADYRMSAVRHRRAYVESLLSRVKSIDTTAWSKDDQVDRVLLQSQLEYDAFFPRVMRQEESNPQLYVQEVANGIFSLLKKEYAPKRVRALAAAARLEQVPALLRTARTNLVTPVKLYAQLASESARGGDDLYTTSLMTLVEGLPEADHARLIKARDDAIVALHAFADWLDARMAGMPEWKPMGPANYNYLLRYVLVLPVDATDIAMLGEVELARFRALEAWLKHPEFASPDPSRAVRIPTDQAEFLRTYEARLTEVTTFLTENKLVTIPSYLGQFQIRQLPEAFKPTSPGGFMNPPGVYDSDPTGCYYIPTYNPKSGNFYIRAAIEDPRPILAHEGIPGHFLQLSIANHLADEIRRQNSDNTFAEGWALYGEEMLMRAGLYPEQSPSQGQVLRLSRYRAARVGVDVNLQTGRWTFQQAVRYFMEAGGLDQEAATGEAAGAASSPGQKIAYMVGKWQIMRLLARYRDAQGVSFRLGAFHDQLISYGTLPLSVIEWLMFDDDTTVRRALGR
jgi:uncharacterized protein (DUF885 family)